MKLMTTGRGDRGRSSVWKERVPIGMRSFHRNEVWNAFFFKYRNEEREKVPFYDGRERKFRFLLFYEKKQNYICMHLHFN